MAEDNTRNSFFALLKRSIGKPVQPTFGTTGPEKGQ